MGHVVTCRRMPPFGVCVCLCTHLFMPNWYQKFSFLFFVILAIIPWQELVDNVTKGTMLDQSHYGIVKAQRIHFETLKWM